MNARTALNGGLLAAVAALALVAVLEPGIEEPPTPPPLTGVDRATVDTLVVSREGQPVIRLERRDQGWRLTEPLELPANDFKVESLLDLLEASSQGRVAAGAGELGRFGLDPPRAAVDFAGTVVAFGDTDPLDGHRYVRVDDTVHLVRDRFYHHLMAIPAGYGDPRLLGPEAVLERVDLGAGGELSRDDAGWRLSPAPEGISADAAVALAEAWRQARAMGVEAVGDVPEHARRVRVWLAGRKDPLVFRVFQDDGAYLFARPRAGVAYRLTEGAGEALLEPPREPAPASGEARETDETPRPDTPGPRGG